MPTADDKHRLATEPVLDSERASVAHQLNNALAIILGNAQVALLESSQTPKVAESLREILAAGQRARDLIRTVMTLSPPAPPHESGMHQLSLDELRNAVSLRPTQPRLLYVDDEEALVLLAIRHLKRLGYDVVGATSADEALALFQREPHGFAAVMTDLNMPGSSGLVLAREILQLRPDVPVIVASGFVSDELHAAAKAAGVREVVYKPSTIEELAELVHTILAKP
jgi:CheY-like chemotaxis protein